MIDVARLGELCNFLIDSGSQAHVIRNPELFVCMRKSRIPCIQPVGDEDIPVVGERTICRFVCDYGW